MSMQHLSPTISGHRHEVWRIAGVALTVIIALTALAPARPSAAGATSLLRVIRILLMGLIPAAAAVFGWLTARHFVRGEAGRRVWVLITFAALSDFCMFEGLLVPRLLGLPQAIGPVTLTITGLMVLSRIAMALALWIMVKVYRGTGLGFHLHRSDYFLMALLLVFGVVSVALSNSVARSQVVNPEMAREVQFVGLPLLPALVVCSIFGVMLWRYAKQMEGGFVAKAWRYILLYTAVWLGRLTILGVYTYRFGSDPTQRPLLITIANVAALLGAECLLLLGTSYQHQGCAAVAPPPAESVSAAIA